MGSELDHDVKWDDGKVDQYAKGKWEVLDQYMNGMGGRQNRHVTEREEGRE
jgi:hypothetical protein